MEPNCVTRTTYGEKCAVSCCWMAFSKGQCNPHCLTQCVCVQLLSVETLHYPSFQFYTLPVREERVDAERRGEGGGRDQIEEGERWVTGKGAMSSVRSVCTCVTQSTVSSVLCCFIQERGFMLTCSCHCCYSYTVSGFIWKRVFVLTCSFCVEWLLMDIVNR